MDEMKFSKIKHTHSLHKWVLPFQSWSQFTSFVFFEAVGALAVLLIMKLDPNVPIWVFFSALLGGIPPLYAVLPGRLEFEKSGLDTNVVINLIGDSLLVWGYVACDAPKREFRFQSKLPNWLRWKENEVLIKYSGSFVVIEGPVYILKKLERKLNTPS
jgi:hypothetical protein